MFNQIMGNVMEILSLGGLVAIITTIAILQFILG